MAARKRVGEYRTAGPSRLIAWLQIITRVVTVTFHRRKFPGSVIANNRNTFSLLWPHTQRCLLFDQYRDGVFLQQKSGGEKEQPPRATPGNLVDRAPSRASNVGGGTRTIVPRELGVAIHGVMPTQIRIPAYVTLSS